MGARLPLKMRIDAKVAHFYLPDNEARLQAAWLKNSLKFLSRDGNDPKIPGGGDNIKDNAMLVEEIHRSFEKLVKAIIVSYVVEQTPTPYPDESQIRRHYVSDAKEEVIRTVHAIRDGIESCGIDMATAERYTGNIIRNTILALNDAFGWESRVLAGTFGVQPSPRRL